MKALVHHNIIVKPSAIHGYGVFATKDIPANTIIEECYCIISDMRDSNLENYYFQDGQKVVLPAGFGFIYNHSPTPNAHHQYNKEKKILIIKSKKPIRANEEIFISYGDKEWFLERNISIKKTFFLQRCLHFLNGAPARAVIAISGLFIAMYLMNALTALQQIQKNPEMLSMTIPQEIDT